MIRIGVLKRKVSFGSKSAKGAQAYATLLSIYTTCKLRDIHNMRNSIAKVEKDVAGDAKALLEKSNQTLNPYETQFEMYRLQLIDSKEGAVQSWNDRKKDITLRLEKMSDKLEQGKRKPLKNGMDSLRKWGSLGRILRKLFRGNYYFLECF